MGPATGNRRVSHQNPINNISQFVQSTATNISSLFIPKPNSVTSSPSRLYVPLPLSPPILSLSDSSRNDSDSFSLQSPSESSSTVRRMSSESSPGLSSTVRKVRISGLSSTENGGGPAFVGQVFSMCDLSGTGLMAVSTHFDIPFISKRTPKWLKKMFQAVMKSERSGPVFHFFMDLGDAVSYVSRLNIPSGVVGACRLDLAYEHFKEKPHLFQFVPNERQVKEANKLLKMVPQKTPKKRVEGVPVFTAQNLDIAIATSNGIKWYTPYFFDKNKLDNILEESVDQHFDSLIQTRHLERRREIIDDNIADVLEDSTDSIWEPPEVQEVLDEIGTPSIPLSIITKAAEMELLYTVDKVLLGNRWLRKATGIQPKFPYVVDSFEKRSAASYQRASMLQGDVPNAGLEQDQKQLQHFNPPEVESKDDIRSEQESKSGFHQHFRDWLTIPLKRKGSATRECLNEESYPTPFLPKITMVGVATGEAGPISKATLKKTMDNLTKELEQTDQVNMAGGGEYKYDDERDPLFVANVGEYYSGLSKSGPKVVRPRSTRT